ncbi:MAG: hypothetical protein HQK52_01680 [Oligoflexia bacterium]|nr:hypothetical protein [Oligoflexia bacterium]
MGLDLSLHRFYGSAEITPQKNYSNILLNRKGYRGAIHESKQKEEIRILALGDSNTFGQNVNTAEAWPFLLEQDLQKTSNLYQVINAGLGAQGIYGVYHDLLYFDSLHYDIAIIFSGYNDSSPTSLRTGGRGLNGFFHTFGHWPILPTLLYEKANILKHGLNNLTYVYMRDRGEDIGDIKIPYNKNLLSLGLGFLLGFVSDILSSTNKLLAANESYELKDGPKDSKEYALFLFWIKKTFDLLIEKNKNIYYVIQPKRGDTSKDLLVKNLIAQEPYNNKIKVVDFSSLIEMSDPTLVPDGLHFNLISNKIIAEKLKEVIVSK